MNRSRLFVPASLTVAALAVVAGSIAVADPAKEAAPAKEASKGKDAAPAGQPDMQLPPGWTEEDMKACVMAATPGKMHEKMAKDAGIWAGKTSMWMAPGAEPMKSECTSTMTPIMDGRYLKVEIAGEMPGMGPFVGFGINGYDNVAQKFVSTWIDNQGTGIMYGTGELSADGKVLTWKFTYNCPITKKPVIMREVETHTGPDSMTLEMFGPEPKSGKEYKMMSIEFSRKKTVAQAK